jgi:hypothetical protein
MECLACGYILAGLTAHRCPECNRVFNSADPSTFNTTHNKWYDGRFCMTIAAALALYLILTLASLLLAIHAQFGIGLFLLLIVFSPSGVSFHAGFIIGAWVDIMKFDSGLWARWWMVLFMGVVAWAIPLALAVLIIF